MGLQGVLTVYGVTVKMLAGDKPCARPVHHSVDDYADSKLSRDRAVCGLGCPELAEFRKKAEFCHIATGNRTLPEKYSDTRENV
jgi:hypothetical protein